MDPNERPDIVVRVQQLEKDIKDSLEKNHLTIKVYPYFPIYNVLPVEVQLALKVCEKYGVAYKWSYSEAEEQKA